MTSPTLRRRIAVVGGGAAGMTAALLLQERHDVSLFEREGRLGGHAHGVTVHDDQGRPLEVDTAFLVFNEGTYPRFLRLLERLGVRDDVVRTEMSTSYFDPHRNFVYALGKGARRVLAQKRNLASPSFARLLFDIARFRRTSHERLDRLAASRLTLGELLRRDGYSARFATDFAAPMSGAIWSLPAGTMLDFPARTFLAFFANHRQARERARGTRTTAPGWLAFRGSSRTYVRALERAFTAAGGRVRHQRVTSVEALERTALVRFGASRETFDDVVLATHADEALALLERPTALQASLLGPWRYHRSRATLHGDARVLPRDRRLWSSWNMRYDARTLARDATVTYHLNAVQGLRQAPDLFVSLGDGLDVAASSVRAEFTYAHPAYTFEAVATQPRLPELNGAGPVLFCGSYFGFGFHEDAVRAGEAVAHARGCALEGRA